MKKTQKRYIVHDPVNNFYWVENVHYGYTTGNRPVFETRFTDDLAEATMVSKKRAEEVIAKYSEYEFVLGGRFKADAKALVVAGVQITYTLVPIDE